jgi:3-oxoacyl-[acyl-carrier-protein] synthase III
MNARILGIGRHIPERVVTNDDLAKLMDTSDEWIQQRTGIRQRHFIAADAGPGDLAAPAARQALEDAGIEAKDLDLVILGSLSPDYDFPCGSSVVARHLGLRGVPVMDVRNQCSGFVYMLAMADKFVRTGGARHVLVMGAETHSTGLDQTTAGREVAVIFGDGAAGVVVGPEPDAKKGILTTHLHSEGKFAKKLMVEVPTSLCQPRVSPEMLAGPGSRLWPRMEGRYVFKHAVTRFPEVIQEALAATGHTVADLDLLIPHQANLRISQMVAMGLELPPEKVFNNIERYGNTTAASIPLALYEAREQGLVREGALVCLAAFGAGFTWGAALLRW